MKTLDDWFPIGHYDLALESVKSRFPLKDEDGDPILNEDGEMTIISIERHVLHVKHRVSGDITDFKHYKHQGRWRWSDSRDDGPCNFDHVVAEVGRMVFGGDLTETERFLNCLFPSLDPAEKVRTLLAS
jgi:hypothetical protein